VESGPLRQVAVVAEGVLFKPCLIIDAKVLNATLDSGDTLKRQGVSDAALMRL